MKKIILTLAVLALANGSMLAQSQKSEAKDTMFVVHQAKSKDGLDSLAVRYYPVSKLNAATHTRPTAVAQKTSHIASTVTAKTDTMFVLYNADGKNVLETYNVPKVDSVVFDQPEWSKFKDISGICPNGNHPHIIDLGLTSGNCWQCCNVGAREPKAYGELIAWGETAQRKNEYILTNYKWYKSSDPNDTEHYDANAKTLQYCKYIYEKDFVGSKTYDAARVRAGGAWVMPTKTDFEELIKECTYEVVWVEGQQESVIQGYLLTGPNKKQLFLPAAGHYWRNDPVNERGVFGLYWSSTPWPICYKEDGYALNERKNSNYNDFAYCLQFHIGAPITVGAYYRFSGRSIRPVYNPKSIIQDKQ